MKNLLLVPIEPLTERYTESWYRNFPPLFQQAGFEVTIIDGKPLLDNEIHTGTFLDINSTVHYKMVQLQTIAQLFHEGRVKDGTVFFFADIEFWGVEAVRLLSQMNNVRIKMCGFLHAASYTIEDAFSIAAPYQQFTEVGWLAAMDSVFVGSHYHKMAVILRRLMPQRQAHLASKLLVTGAPLFLSDYEFSLGAVAKQKKVLLTNRFDSEKRPGLTLYLFERLKETFSDWEFVITTSRATFKGNDSRLIDRARALESKGILSIRAGLSKAQYHKELEEAALMVSHSIEENYGYCIAEALTYGVLPFLRTGLSHDEFLRGDTRLSFTSPGEDFLKAKKLLDSFGTEEWPSIPRLMTDGAANIVKAVAALSLET